MSNLEKLIQQWFTQAHYMGLFGSDAIDYVSKQWDMYESQKAEKWIIHALHLIAVSSTR